MSDRSTPPDKPDKPQQLRAPTIDNSQSNAAVGQYVSLSPKPSAPPYALEPNSNMPASPDVIGLNAPSSQNPTLSSSIPPPLPLPSDPSPPSFDPTAPYNPDDPMASEQDAGATPGVNPTLLTSIAQSDSPSSPTLPFYSHVPSNGPYYPPSPSSGPPHAPMAPEGGYYSSGGYSAAPGSIAYQQQQLPQQEHQQLQHPLVTSPQSMSHSTLPPMDSDDVKISDALFLDAERHRSKAALAQKERFASGRAAKEEGGKFTNRVSAAGTYVVKWFEEMRHESKAKELERKELNRHLKVAQAQRKASRASQTSPTGQPP